MAAAECENAGATRLPSDDAELLRRAGFDATSAPAAGLFDDASWLRRVSREPALLFGGGRALLLEVAHPLVAAGVAEHSNFRRDPFGRLRRTLDAMGAIAFGSAEAALAAARSVERAHAGVRGALVAGAGPFAAGSRYDGRDPALMCWVWATLVDTAIAVYARFVAPLDAEALADYYADQVRMARLLGMPAASVPEDYAAFRDYVDGMLEGDALVVTSQAREIARGVLRPPGEAPGGGIVRLITAALLPPRLRSDFGLAWDDERAARLDALTRSVRALRRPAAAGSVRLDARRDPR